jgi:hypothetical protein
MMGTRGALGFYKDGKTKVTYNHWDSYLSGLGNDVLNFIHSYLSEHTIDELKTQADAIEMVNESDSPTDEQKQRCKKYVDLNVGSQSEDEWYCLLREAQGDLGAYLEVGVMIDSQDFLQDSLFCEWAYIINLDTNMLEIYRGFQTEKPAGRYTDIPPSEKEYGHDFGDGKEEKYRYYAVGLLKEYPLDDCPKDMDALQKEIEENEDED